MANLRDLANQAVRPKFKLPEIKVEPSPLVTNVTSNYASEFHQRLVDWINDFDKSLDDEYEVGVRLVSFGQTITFHLQDLGYWNPSLISFRGVTADNEPVELIQHVSQISILLMKVPRLEPDKPKEPLGFRSGSILDEAEAED